MIFGINVFQMKFNCSVRNAKLCITPYGEINFAKIIIALMCALIVCHKKTFLILGHGCADSGQRGLILDALRELVEKRCSVDLLVSLPGYAFTFDGISPETCLKTRRLPPPWPRCSLPGIDCNSLLARLLGLGRSALQTCRNARKRWRHSASQVD